MREKPLISISWCVMKHNKVKSVRLSHVRENHGVFSIWCLQ